MTTPCTHRYCHRPADLRIGDLALCARHYKADVKQAGAGA